MKESLKVKIFLSRPVLMSNRILTLDKLVSAILFGRGRFNEKYKQEALEEIFEYRDGVPAASIFFANTPIVYDNTALTLNVSRSRDIYMEFIKGKINDSIFNTQGSGPWKMSRTTFITFYTDYIYFYAIADKEKLLDVLRSNLVTIGKKAQYGYGAVLGVEVEKIDEEKAYMLNEWTPSRPLPIGWDVKTDNIALYNINGPAWDRKGLEPCFMPPSSLGERVYESKSEPNYTLETISSTEFVAKYHPDEFFKPNKKINSRLVENTHSKPCSICGIVSQKGVYINGVDDIQKITSASFTDYRNLNLKNDDFFCEYCAKALTNGATTRKPTLYTKKEIETGKITNLLKSIPDDSEYVLLYHQGMQKHILTGSLPSISSSYVAVNFPDHILGVMDIESFNKAFDMVLEYEDLKSTGISSSIPLGKKNEIDLDVYEKFSSLVNPTILNILMYLSKDEVSKAKKARKQKEGGVE